MRIRILSLASWASILSVLPYSLSGLTRNHSQFSQSNGIDISWVLILTSTILLTFTCSHLFTEQTTLWACLLVLMRLIPIPSLQLFPHVLRIYYVFSALLATLYLILPTTCFFGNEKIKFKWLTQDHVACTWLMPGIKPDSNQSFAMPGCLGSCGFLNNLVLCICGIAVGVKSQQWQSSLLTGPLLGIRCCLDTSGQWLLFMITHFFLR